MDNSCLSRGSFATRRISARDTRRNPAAHLATIGWTRRVDYLSAYLSGVDIYHLNGTPVQRSTLLLSSKMYYKTNSPLNAERWPSLDAYQVDNKVRRMHTGSRGYPRKNRGLALWQKGSAETVTSCIPPRLCGRHRHNEISHSQNSNACRAA